MRGIERPAPGVRLAVSGATGRMGHTILELAAADPRFRIVGGLEGPGHPALGKPLSRTLPSLGPKVSAPVVQELGRLHPAPQVLIDFTQPAGTLAYLKQALKLKVGMVIGTTGFSDGQRKVLRAASARIPILQSYNMSSGMNLLFALVEEAAAKLGTSYDVEITEAHHNLKKDAPSGSAIRLGEGVARAWKKELSKVSTHGRKGQVGARKGGTIGFHAVRGGDIVGDHTVLYAGPGERLELTHRAHSRSAFAQGALKAALFLAGKKKGFFDMWDVLGLKGK